MKRKRNIQTSALLLLRRLGMLCKLPRDEKPKLRIARTVYPAGRVNTIESEQHVWIQTKLMSRQIVSLMLILESAYVAQHQLKNLL